MACEEVIIVGAGGGTGELIALAKHSRSLCGEPDWKLVGILDDDPKLLGTTVYGLPVVGTLDDARRFGNARFLSGIANAKTTAVRLKVAQRLDLPPERWTKLIHPRAVVVDPGAVGYGAIIYPGAVVSAEARIGPHSLLYYNAIVHHHSVVGQGCCVCASVSIAGCVTIGDGCYLGIGAVVRDYLKIGDGALIGMGSVVVKDVSAGERVAGVPARPIGKK